MILKRIAQMRTGGRRGVMDHFRPPSGSFHRRPAATGPVYQLQIQRNSRRVRVNGHH